MEQIGDGIIILVIFFESFIAAIGVAAMIHTIIKSIRDIKIMLLKGKGEK